MALSESYQMGNQKSTHPAVNSSLHSCRNCVHAVGGSNAEPNITVHASTIHLLLLLLLSLLLCLLLLPKRFVLRYHCLLTSILRFLAMESCFLLIALDFPRSRSMRK